MSLTKPGLIHPTERHIAWRKLFTSIWRWPYAPARVEIVEGGIQRGDDLLEQGWGIVLPFTHFSARDIFEMTLRPFAASRVLVRKPAVVGIEWSHFWGLSAPRFFAGVTGINLVPIVTEDTLKKRKNYDDQRRALPLGHGTIKYLSLARQALEEGAIVFVSPQQGRRPGLELSDKEPIKFLLGKENDSHKVAMLFLSLSLHNEMDYSKRGFLNLGRTFDVKMGPTLTKAELFKLSRDMGKSLDDLTIIIFSLLVDPGYNHVDPELSKSYLLNRH
jgi:hypothetical protein